MTTSTFVPILRGDATGGSAGSQTINRFPTAGLDKLHVDGGVIGRLLLAFDGEHEASVQTVGSTPLPLAKFVRTGNQLVVVYEDPEVNRRPGQLEATKVEIHVPRRTRVVARLQEGSIILAGGEGDLTIDGQSVTVRGFTNARNVAIRLQSGDVALHNLIGAAEIDVSSGRIVLGWDVLRGTERVRARCGHGIIDFAVPPGARVVEDASPFVSSQTVIAPPGARIVATTVLPTPEIPHQVDVSAEISAHNLAY